MPDRFFIDTNVLVYAHDSASPEKKERSQDVIFGCMREGSGVISAQVLSEFFVTVTRKIAKPLTDDRARHEIALLATMECVDIDATLVAQAIGLKGRWGVSYWDALILAAAQRAECTIVYSEDLSSGQTYGKLTVADPYQAPTPPR